MIVEDTICALATPPGAGGLAVVRLSGADAMHIADKCFKGKITLIQAHSHTIHYGVFQDKQDVLDTVTASIFRNPHSYTGEDVVEFGCHGGVLVSQRIVQTLIANGARHAEPGEFTKRAFLNKKMDLTQVEAVADLIHAVSIPGGQTAAQQLLGGFTKRLRTLREDLLETCGLLELELDFSEEDIEFVDKDALLSRLRTAYDHISDLADSFHASEILRNGYNVGLVGFPNAGKSSLLNALVRKERAIVSSMPGTTRDYIEETIHLNGIQIKIYDTAGLRPTDDEIEIEGLKLADSLLKQCHLILVINDVTLGARHSDELANKLRVRFNDAEIVIIQNKIDLSEFSTDPALTDHKADGDLAISAKTGFNMEGIKHTIKNLSSTNARRVADVLINARQSNLLRDVGTALQSAITSLESNLTNEFVAIDVRSALKTIGEITGDVWSEDVLSSVFERFCIGK